MNPKNLSASSGEVYENCPARYEAEFDGTRARGVTGDPASIGTVCHAVLERWVKEGFYRTAKTGDPKDFMYGLYAVEYYKVFSDSRHFNSGLRLVSDWRSRQDWTGRTVLTVEKRDSFNLKTSQGDLPFVYVIDRLDRLDSQDLQIEVVDYKTVAVPVSADELKHKLQVRAYAVAAQILYPEAEKIWVTFDLLRHGYTVGTCFTKQENRDNFVYLRSLAQRIVDNKSPQETLNPDCRWCIRKHVCTALNSHLAVGGPLGIDDVAVAAVTRHWLENQKKGIEGRINDLDELLLQYMEREELLEFRPDPGGSLAVEVTARRTRVVDPERAAPILGPALMTKYAGLTMKAVDELLKGSEITTEQKAQLKALIRTHVGSPGISVKVKK